MSGFVTRCLFSTPENGLEEISCNVAKQAATAGIMIGTCYVVSLAGGTVIPPLTTLAPMCNFGGAVPVPVPPQSINWLKKLAW